MSFLLFMMGVAGLIGWLIALVVCCAYAADYKDKLEKMGITRAEAILGGVFAPVAGWWLLWKIHQHDKRHIRRLEEARLDREIERLEGK